MRIIKPIALDCVLVLDDFPLKQNGFYILLQ